MEKEFSTRHITCLLFFPLLRKWAVGHQIKGILKATGECFPSVFQCTRWECRCSSGCREKVNVFKVNHSILSTRRCLEAGSLKVPCLAFIGLIRS